MSSVLGMLQWLAKRQGNARGHVKAACRVNTCKYEADHSCSDGSTDETKEKKSKNNKEGKGESGTADVWSWTLDPLSSLVGIGRGGVIGNGFERKRDYGSTGRRKGEVEEGVGTADGIERNVEYKSPVKSESEDICKFHELFAGGRC